MTDGIVPTLTELVALRGAVGRRFAARQGRFGTSGHARSPLRGRGMEYAESREYSPGDDARHIDWRLTARTGRAHTKLFQAERERLTLILADTSPALFFGTRVRFKSVQAARVGAVAAWAAVRDGDRVAAVSAIPGEPPAAPGPGTRGALRVIDALARWYAQAPVAHAGLELALDHARRLLRPGSRLLVLGDAASIANVADARWLAFAREHEVVVLLMTDPLETEPPHTPVPFATDGHRTELDFSIHRVRQGWRQAFALPVETLLRRLPQQGVQVQAVSTVDASESWLGLLGRARPQVA